MKTKYIWLFFFALTVLACNNDDEISEITGENLPALTTGEANFTNYVSIGNSLTAGYSDGALFKASQEASLPALLSLQFNLLVDAEFNQPLMSDNTGGLLLGGTQIAANRLVFNGSGPARLETVIGAVTPTTDVLSSQAGPFQNLGVPGAKSFHLLAPGYGNPGNIQAGLANPYFARMTGSSPNARVIELAVAQQPTFFTLWIGNNDVLGYATTGGDGTDPITSEAMFTGAYTGIINALKATGAQGLIANIPNVTTIPYFTTVPHNPLSPANPAFGPQIPTLNNIFGAINGIYDALGMPERKIVFATDAASAVVIKDETLANISAQITGALNASPTFPAFIAQFGLPPQAAPNVAALLGATYGQTRQANENDLLVLPSSSIIGTVNTANVAALVAQGLPQALAGQFSAEGITLPLADKWVLLPSEQAEVQAATTAFNTTIKTMAEANGYAFFDAFSLLSRLSTTGLTSGDYTLNASLVTGGAFSLDGVHPTSRGYALIANEMLKVIDAKYNTNFEASGSFLNIGDYPTNYSATLQ